MRKGGRSMEQFHVCVLHSRYPRSPSGASRVSDETLGCIFAHLDNPADRRAVSQVCKQWKRVDSNTRKCVRIANCYSVAPATLSRRFPNLHSLKIKGKPRAFDFSLLPLNWGGYAMPWVAEVANSYRQKLQCLWLRRMQVTDADLTLLASSCSESLLTLKLHKCSGFSTSGLLDITSCCRSLKVLFMEECELVESESPGKWLHELALHNYNLEELNFQDASGLDPIDVNDLELLVENCKSLRSLKVNDVDILEMGRVLSRASTLEELGTGCFVRIEDPQTSPPTISFPRSIIGLSGLYYLTDICVPLVSGMLANLKKLHLQFSVLTEEGYCEILKHCTKLEVLEATNALGDRGLITLARTCKDLRRIRIDDQDDGGFVSPAGIIPFVQACVKLEFLVMYISDINNASLAAIGENCTVLKDCRIVLLSKLEVVADLPLDEGLKSLLRGCRNLTRLAIYVRHRALTDKGMAYIGEYGGKLKWVLLGCAGESDWGLSQLANGCHSLERLEMRDCPVTESGLAGAAVTLQNSLKFIWVQGYHATEAGGRLLAGSRPYWIVETSSGSPELPGQVTAYCSLAAPRSDHPPEIVLVSDGDDQLTHENGGA